MRKYIVLVMLPFMCLLLIRNAMSLDDFFNTMSQKQVEFRPVVVYQTDAEAGDKAFTDAATKGAEKAKKELGINYELRRITTANDREDVLASLAKEGFSPIIAVGFQNVVPILQLADKHPSTRFTVIDGIVPPLFNNVQSINFKDHEGAFLVGMIAAYKSNSGKVGFIGGMDVPLIRNFATGFKQGVEYAKPDTTVTVDMIGTSIDAWSNPARGAELANKQVDAGVDVIFAAAGGSGVGVLKALAEKGKYGIGVDINQNGLFPGHVLTSMIKRVDLAVYDALKNSHEGTWEPGIKYLGIKEYVLDYAVDTHNKSLITKQMIDKVEDAKDKIVNGLLDIEIYSPN